MVHRKTSAKIDDSGARSKTTNPNTYAIHKGEGITRKTY